MGLAVGFDVVVDHTDKPGNMGWNHFGEESTPFSYLLQWLKKKE